MNKCGEREKGIDVDVTGCPSMQVLALPMPYIVIASGPGVKVVGWGFRMKDSRIVA